MAATLIDRTWRASTPATIEHDLSALWRDVGAKGRIARAMMSNLVVIRAARIQRRADISIDAVAGQHPSRVLIIDHEAAADAGVCSIAAVRVGVVTFGPPEARYGVEQIAVRSTCTDDSLPSLVCRLARGDLPISVWWAEDLSRVPLLPSLLDLGRQFVYDSRQWYDVRQGVLAVTPWQHLDLVDVNWRRLAAIRRAMIVAAGMAGHQDWPPEAIQIRHRPADSALAWLLVGWLASRLGWSGGRLPRVEGAIDGDAVVTITIGSGADRIRIRSDGRQVAVQPAADRSASVLSIAHEGEADAVAAELHTLAHDVRLHDALSALQRHFSAA